MEITVKIVRILDEQTVGQNNFKIRHIHADTEEASTQRLDIQFTQERTKDLDNYKPGERVKLKLNLKGREVTDANQKVKVYNTIQAWKIERV